MTTPTIYAYVSMDALLDGERLAAAKTPLPTSVARLLLSGPRTGNDAELWLPTLCLTVAFRPAGSTGRSSCCYCCESGRFLARPQEGWSS